MAITYTPATNFGAKDTLPTNDPGKVIKGAEFTTEFNAIQTAFGLAAPAASPTFTGTATFDNIDVTGTVKLNGNFNSNNNVGLGSLALNSLTAFAINNVGLGSEALSSNSNGSNNIAIGYQALNTNSTGNNNIAIGTEALYNNKTVFNIGIGYRALKDNTFGNNNVGIGLNVLYQNQTGLNNVAVGVQALSGNITANNNTAIGHLSLLSNNANNNTGLGYYSGKTLTSGTDNTFIGHNTQSSSSSASEQIVIGSDVAGTANSRITVGISSNIAELDLDGVDTSWAASSDERLKKDITDYTAGLSFISELRPVTYKWRAKCDVPEDLSLHDNSNDPVHGKLNVTYHGFVAQEVKQALDNHPEVADGQHFWKLRDDGIQTVAPADLVPILVNAIKELASRLEAAEAEIKILHGV